MPVRVLKFKCQFELIRILIFKCTFEYWASNLLFVIIRILKFEFIIRKYSNKWFEYLKNIRNYSNIRIATNNSNIIRIFEKYSNTFVFEYSNIQTVTNNSKDSPSPNYCDTWTGYWNFLAADWRDESTSVSTHCNIVDFDIKLNRIA